jgi:hypothetical protein
MISTIKLQVYMISILWILKTLNKLITYIIILYSIYDRIYPYFRIMLCHIMIMSKSCTVVHCVVPIFLNSDMIQLKYRSKITLCRIMLCQIAVSYHSQIVSFRIVPNHNRHAFRILAPEGMEGSSKPLGPFLVSRYVSTFGSEFNYQSRCNLFSISYIFFNKLVGSHLLFQSQCKF